MLKLILVLVLTKYVNSNNYCQLKCDDNTPKHDMCKYEGCPIQKPCFTDARQQPLTPAEQKLIVDMHNFLRSKIAKGKEKLLPKATNMMKLHWDEELETLAQCWANQCLFEHNTCRMTLNGEYYGQNLALSGTNGPLKYLTRAQKLRDHINSWFSEIELFRKGPKIDERIEKFGRLSGAGHFTQLIWANTSRIGCGRVVYFAHGYNRTNFVCNYVPGGNVLTQSIYEVGPTTCKKQNAMELCLF